MELVYSRTKHLIGLILLAILYIVLIVVGIIGGYGIFVVGYIVCVIIYVVLWWLRSLSALAKWFPLFHYITLVVEFVYHCISLLYGIYWSITSLLTLFSSFKLFWLLYTIAIIVITIAYVLLVFFTLPVPFILLKGTVAQKAELAKEVTSSAAVNLPGGATVPSQA